MGRAIPEKGSKIFRDFFAAVFAGAAGCGPNHFRNAERAAFGPPFRRQNGLSSKQHDHLAVVMMMVVPPPELLVMLAVMVMVVMMAMMMMVVAMSRGRLDRGGERPGGNEGGDEA